MKHPQVINLNEDAVMAFIGSNVIEAGTQLLMNTIEASSLLVDIKLWDLISNAPVTIEGLTMTYIPTSRFWTIDISGVSGDLLDRHKYVGTVCGNIAETENLEPFQITEFAVDNDSFEDVLMRLPYEIVIDGGEAHFVWYAAGQIGVAGQERFYASAYEGGTGTTFASDTSRVTHRGDVTTGAPPV